MTSTKSCRRSRRNNASRSTCVRSLSCRIAGRKRRKLQRRSSRRPNELSRPPGTIRAVSPRAYFRVGRISTNQFRAMNANQPEQRRRLKKLVLRDSYGVEVQSLQSPTPRKWKKESAISDSMTIPVRWSERIATGRKDS